MKKCITIALIFCMLLALASCGKTDTSSPENSISIDTENVEESEETEYSESEQSEYTEPEEEFITVDGSTIKNATGYHNGYNYVTFNDGTSAVFDKEGMEVARFPFAMEYEYTKWLNDDLLLVAGDGFYAYDYYREFVILSLSEGITYDSTKNEEREWTCLGAYGNTILVQRYLQGFNVDATYQVGFTDQYGTEPESWIDVPDTAEIDHDLGDGMYQIHFKGEKNDQSKDIYRLTDSNLNHTGIYLYSKGKIMIHLTFDYKTDEKCTTPGQYLKYHRTFQGLTTRELAEKVGIVPATLVLYENDRHPIKHDIAVALANTLGIDRNRLLDEYTAFVDYPYSSLLKKVRHELSLTQMQMAEVIGIGQTTYSGWEREARVPRRKEHDKILAALKKLKVNVDTYLCQSTSI